MPLHLLHTPGWSPSPLREALAAEHVATQEVSAATVGGLVLPHGPTVLLLDPDAVTRVDGETLRAVGRAGIAVVALGAPGQHDLPSHLPDRALSAFVAHPAAPRPLLLALRTAFREAAARGEARLARAETALRASEVAELTEIGAQLLTERDHRALLRLILSQARRITNSDAGSFYLVEREADGATWLRFTHAQNESRPDLPFTEQRLPLDGDSLAGHAALSGEPLVVDDVDDIAPDAPFAFNRSFDERSGYRTKSVLTIPMSDHSGQVIGVLQLINRKLTPGARLDSADAVEREVLPFSPHTVRLVRALAGQAAVSLENSQLQQSIERLFEGFVRAAVHAIEQRDPGTSGHSERVAGMCVRLAETVDATPNGPYGRTRFTAPQIQELRYAALLHDFGKVSVREEVLAKPRKLYASDLALLRQRHDFLVRTAQWRFERERADRLERMGREGYDEFMAELEARHARARGELDRFLELVEVANEPAVLPAGDFAELQALSGRTYPGLDGRPRPFLSEAEVRYLTIPQGSLDEAERREIESHVTHTYQFLQRIPWTRELARVPDIAHAHHEKLNGRGYPRRIAGDEIPVQARIMTIADVFDALTAADRPYKRAVPVEQALGILGTEVTDGTLDGELFRLFVEAGVYTR